MLYVGGYGKASHRLEQFFDEVAHEESIAIFCSFLMDHYDPSIYDEALGNVCRTHSHLIPTSDYANHRDAVNRAIADVIGPIKGAMLGKLASWAGTETAMPSSQAVLLWLKETSPQNFVDVLERAKRYDRALRAAGGNLS